MARAMPAGPSLTGNVMSISRHRQPRWLVRFKTWHKNYIVVSLIIIMLINDTIDDVHSVWSCRQCEPDKRTSQNDGVQGWAQVQGNRSWTRETVKKILKCPILITCKSFRERMGFSKNRRWHWAGQGSKILAWGPGILNKQVKKTFKLLIYLLFIRN